MSSSWISLRDSKKEEVFSEGSILLSSSSKSLTSAEQAFKQEYDSALDTLTSDLPAYKVRKSLKEILAEKNKKEDKTCLESSAKPSALRIDEIEPIEQNIEQTEEDSLEEVKSPEKTSSFLESLKEIQEELIYEEEEIEEIEEEDEEYNENEDPSFDSSFDPDEF